MKWKTEKEGGWVGGNVGRLDWPIKTQLSTPAEASTAKSPPITEIKRSPGSGGPGVGGGGGDLRQVKIKRQMGVAG